MRGLVEHRDAHLVGELIEIRGHAFEVLLEQHDVRHGRHRATLLGHRGALEHAERARIEAIGDELRRRHVVDQDRHVLETRARDLGQLVERGARDALELVLGDRDPRRWRAGVERAHLLPRLDHRGALAGRLVNAAAHVKRVGAEQVIALGDLGPAQRGARIFGRERELGEIERELRVVDHGARELGECGTGAFGILDREQRFGTDHDRLDEIRLLVDELEGLVEDIERAIGIADIVEVDAGETDPRHRVIGPQLGELAILRERRVGVAARVGKRGAERDRVGMLAIDAVTAGERGFCFLEIAALEGLEPTIDIRGETILTGHDSCIPLFAIGRSVYDARMKRPVFLAIAALACACGRDSSPAKQAPKADEPKAAPNAQPAAAWAYQPVPGLKLRVELPACAKPLELSPSEYSLAPDDPGCPLPLATALVPGGGKPHGYFGGVDDVVAQLKQRVGTEVQRADKRGEGFRIEFTSPSPMPKEPPTHGLIVRKQVAGKIFDCFTEGSTAEQITAVARACESLQPLEPG